MLACAGSCLVGKHSVSQQLFTRQYSCKPAPALTAALPAAGRRPDRLRRLVCQAGAGPSTRKQRQPAQEPVEVEVAAPTADLAHELAADSGDEEVVTEPTTYDRVDTEGMDAPEDVSTHTVETEQYQGAAHAAHEHHTVQGVHPGELVQRLIPQSRLARGGLAALGLFLTAYTLTVVVKAAKKWTSPRAKRHRKVNKNKLVVETINEYLPQHREKLTSGVLRGLQVRSGFNAVEIFRKYLWYVLRERKFDPEVVEDLVYLKAALGLKDEQVAEALKERAQRIYDQYGNVMLDTEGMTKAGIERKATARALFSKMLYLSEYDKLLAQDTPAARAVSIADIFGATTSDIAKLRIVSLYELDLDKMEGQFARIEDEEDEEPEGGAEAQPQ